MVAKYVISLDLDGSNVINGVECWIAFTEDLMGVVMSIMVIRGVGDFRMPLQIVISSLIDIL